MDLCSNIHSLSQCSGTRSLHARIAAAKKAKGQVMVAGDVLENIQKNLKDLAKAVDAIKKGATPVLPVQSEVQGGKGLVVQGKFYSVAELASIPVAEKVVLQSGDFGCTMCAKVFSTEKRLLKHLLLHSGMGRHVCEEQNCTKRFSSKHGLTQHLMSHKPRHVCKVCEIVFSHKASLVRHVELNHAEKGKEVVLFCLHCTKKFQRLYDLTNHEAGCVDNPDRVKAFHCLHKGCSSVFYTAKTRNSHQVKYHRVAGRTVSSSVGAAPAEKQ